MIRVNEKNQTTFTNRSKLSFNVYIIKFEYLKLCTEKSQNCAYVKIKSQNVTFKVNIEKVLQQDTTLITNIMNLQLK